MVYVTLTLAIAALLLSLFLLAYLLNRDHGVTYTDVDQAIAQKMNLVHDLADASHMHKASIEAMEGRMKQITGRISGLTKKSPDSGGVNNELLNALIQSAYQKQTYTDQGGVPGAIAGNDGE